MILIPLGQYYGHPVVNLGQRATAPLRVGAQTPLPLNYGDAESTPFFFELPPGRSLDAGFLRLIVSTHYTELSSIEQAAVVGEEVEVERERGEGHVDGIQVAVGGDF